MRCYASMKRSILIVALLITGLIAALLILRDNSSDGNGVGLDSMAESTPMPACSGDSARKEVIAEREADDLKRLAEKDKELMFMDVMLPYLTTNHLVAIAEAAKRGVVRAPKTFTELAGLAELVGGILKSGKLMDFYEALKVASENDPKNLNLLRMLVLVSSIQGFKEGEYEANLSKLVKLDTNSDVAFPYAQLLLEKGDAAASYSWIEKNVADHPDQAASTLSNALRIYLKAKAVQQKDRVVAQLKEIKVDPFQAHCCGKYLYEGGEFADAAFFYEKNASDEANPYYREAAQVRLCQMQIRNGTQDDKTVATLKELATKSDTPAIQADARRALIELKVDLPNRRSNSSN